MTPRLQYTIDGRSLLIFDDVVTPRLTNALFDTLKTAPFKRQEPDPSKGIGLSFTREVPVATIEGNAFMRLVTDRLRRYLPSGSEPLLYRACFHLGLYGAIERPHRDAELGERSVTALFFINSEWKRAWAAETLFFNERQDSVAAVMPKPGRLVFFDANILHREGMIARNCPYPRVTLAASFRTDVALGSGARGLLVGRSCSSRIRS